MRHPDDRDLTIPPSAPDPELVYRRIVLKLSGEALCGSTGGFGIAPEVLRNVAEELAEVQDRKSVV